MNAFDNYDPTTSRQRSELPHLENHGNSNPNKSGFLAMIIEILSSIFAALFGSSSEPEEKPQPLGNRVSTGDPFARPQESKISLTLREETVVVDPAQVMRRKPYLPDKCYIANKLGQEMTGRITHERLFSDQK